MAANTAREWAGIGEGREVCFLPAKSAQLESGRSYEKTQYAHVRGVEWLGCGCGCWRECCEERDGLGVMCAGVLAATAACAIGY